MHSPSSSNMCHFSIPRRIGPQEKRIFGFEALRSGPYTVIIITMPCLFVAPSHWLPYPVLRLHWICNLQPTALHGIKCLDFNHLLYMVLLEFSWLNRQLHANGNYILEPCTWATTICAACLDGSCSHIIAKTL